MTIQTILIIISAALLVATIVFAALWLKAKAKNSEYTQMNDDYKRICDSVEDYKTDPDESTADTVDALIKTNDVYAPIMDDLIAARKEIKEAVATQHSYPRNAMLLAECIGRRKVLWDKSICTDEQTSKDFTQTLAQIAKEIKDSYKPSEAEAVGLLVKERIRPMLDSLPNYRSFGENERNETLYEMLSLAFATIDAMLFTRQADPANNDNLLQMSLLRGDISDQAAEESARKVTALESETPLWAIRLNTLLQDLADKYHLPKRALILRGYRFDLGA